MEIPNEIMGKIMLFNSHPVADLINQEIYKFNKFRQQFMKYRAKLKQQLIDDGHDYLDLKSLDEFDFDINTTFIPKTICYMMKTKTNYD